MRSLLASASFFILTLCVVIFFTSSNHKGKDLGHDKVVTVVGEFAGIGNDSTGDTEVTVPTWRGPEIKFKPIFCNLKKHILPGGQPVWYVQAKMKFGEKIVVTKVSALVLRPDMTTAYQQLHRRQSSEKVEQANDVYGTYITKLSTAGQYTISTVIETEEQISLGYDATKMIMAAKTIPCGNFTVNSSYEKSTIDYFPPAPVGKVTVMWMNPSKKLVALKWVGTGDDLYEGRVACYRFALTKGKQHGLKKKIAKLVQLDMYPGVAGTVETYNLTLSEFGKFDEVNFYLSACDESGKCANSQEDTLVLRGNMAFIMEKIRRQRIETIKENETEVNIHARGHTLEERDTEAYARNAETEREHIVLTQTDSGEDFEGEGTEDYPMNYPEAELEKTNNESLGLDKGPQFAESSLEQNITQLDGNATSFTIYIRQIGSPDRMTYYVIATCLMFTGLMMALIAVVCLMGYRAERLKYFWILKRKQKA